MSARFQNDLADASGRLHNSVRVNLDARFMPPSREEHACRVVDMSTGEMAIASDVKPQIGDQIIVYIAELGRFEGKVARHEPAGYALTLSLTPLKHSKLAEQLVWYANRSALDLSDSRRNKRFVPLMQLTTVRLANGKERMARINDVSASGVNVEVNVAVTKLTILVGSQVVVGSRPARVVRIYDGGFVAKFDEEFAEGAIDETITL